jgi:antitoxin VapB
VTRGANATRSGVTALALWGSLDWHMLEHMLCSVPENAVIPERHVKLFKNGRNQAVRIPREFELPGDDAIMRKDGDKLIIEPAPPRSLLALLATLPPLEEPLPPIPDEKPDAVDI